MKIKTLLNSLKQWRLWLSLLSIFCSTGRGADFYGIPYGGVFGNTYALEPFAFEELGASSIRYQQVYSASEFGSLLPAGGGIISGVRFGSDDIWGRAFTTGWTNVHLSFALTTQGPDDLSLVFAENIGAGFQTVSGPGGLGLSSPGAGSSTFPIEFQSPYLYNPADGNLLMEIRIFSPSGLPNDPFSRAGPLDAHNNLLSVPDSVSRVFAYDANALSGTADSIGLTTVFTVTPIPEPSTMSLLFLAIGVVAAWSWRKQMNTHNR